MLVDKEKGKRQRVATRTEEFDGGASAQLAPLAFYPISLPILKRGSWHLLSTLHLGGNLRRHRLIPIPFFGLRAHPSSDALRKYGVIKKY
jgi:hypothetical protein